MSLPNGEDFQKEKLAMEDAGRPEKQIGTEAGPRAERPNFLTAARFADLELPTEIQQGLDDAGFEYCTPIQAQAIPVAMEGYDIAGQAQTGTGKTTAFLVPALARLMRNKPLKRNCPRAIIVTPTRELALQVHEDAQVLAGHTGFRQALVIGGIDYKEQADQLRAGPELVICTPGRIIDYLQQGIFDAGGIEVAIVDEADRLLDMGFIKDLKFLLGHLPPFSKRQTMLFSATLDDRVLELTYQFMNPPQFITAEPDNVTKVNIEQELYHIGRDEKLSLLLGLLRREEHRRIIIFCNTKSGVEWLAKKLTSNNLPAEGITGDLPQPKRLKLMEAFKEDRLKILVATDVASRGIHVDDVSHVYNYDLPQDAENYVHRIGRTARAGQAGKAISFSCEDYVFHLEAIENLLGEKIPVCWAEAELFHVDEGADIYFKTKKGDRDRRTSKPEKRGHPESGRRPESGRGSAKSSRPGGIFGLSPRNPAFENGDLKVTLAWKPSSESGTGLSAVEADLEKTAVNKTAEVANELETKDRHRRKRSRNRSRGRSRYESEAATDKAATGQETSTERREGLGAAVKPEGRGRVLEANENKPAPDKVVDKYAKTRYRQETKNKAIEDNGLSKKVVVKSPEKTANVQDAKLKALQVGEAGKSPKPKLIAPVKKPESLVAAKAAVAVEKPKRAPAPAKKAESVIPAKAAVAEKPKRAPAKKAESVIPAKAAAAEKPKRAPAKKAESVIPAKAAAAEKPKRAPAKKAENVIPAKAAAAEKPKRAPAKKAESAPTAKAAAAEKPKRAPAKKAESAPTAKAAAPKKPKRTPAKKAEGGSTAKADAAEKPKWASDKKTPTRSG